MRRRWRWCLRREWGEEVCKEKEEMMEELVVCERRRKIDEGLACQDGFVGLELLPPHVEAAVGEARALPQVPQVVRQLALRYLQHVHVGLARDVDRILDHAHLRGGRATRTGQTVV